MQEIWKAIPGFEGSYEASTLGNIRAVARYRNSRNNGKERLWPMQVLSPYLASSKYYNVDLKINSKKYKKQVHRLVALTFIPNPESKGQVNHKDNNKLNNVVENLEWCSQSENIRHAFDNGFHSGIGRTHYKALKVRDSETKEYLGSISEVAKMFNTYPNKIIRSIKSGKTKFRLELFS